MTFDHDPHGFIDPVQTGGMSGMEILEAMLAGEVPSPPIREPMNFWLYAVGPGTAEFRGVPEHRHCNPMGSVHGGWYGTVLDSVMGCAVMSRLPAGVGYTTLEYKVNITRPVAIGSEVSVIGTSQHAGRRTGVANAEMRGVEDGKLYATASTTCIMFGG